jgi:hypothetical protein
MTPDDFYVGDAIEGYTIAEMAAWQLRGDDAWRAQVIDTNRFIADLDRRLVA